jgi:hypothetical protein
MYFSIYFVPVQQSSLIAVTLTVLHVIKSEEKFGISIFPDRHIMYTVCSLRLLYTVLKRTQLTVGKSGRRYKVNCKTTVLTVYHIDLFLIPRINYMLKIY